MAALNRHDDDTVSPPPYIDLTSSTDEDDDDNQPDSCIFPHERGYPKFLLPRDEVRAHNRFVWLPSDKKRKSNREKCTYLWPLPTRGNCVMCGRSGKLGGLCTNGCRYDAVSVDNIMELNTVPERSDKFVDDADLHIKQGERVHYWMILTPKHGYVIDAVYFAELMYKGVDEEEDHYEEWIQRSEKFRKRMHDKIPSDEQKWDDPWVFQFQLDKECNWWRECDFAAKGENLDFENPTPGMKKRYQKEITVRKRRR